MERDYRFLRDAGVMVTYILLFGWPLGILGGPVGYYSRFPKHDDAYTHASKVLFPRKDEAR